MLYEYSTVLIVRGIQNKNTVNMQPLRQQVTSTVPYGQLCSSVLYRRTPVQYCTVQYR